MITIKIEAYVYVHKNNSSTFLCPYYKIKTPAYIGKNGVTKNKIEGDGKTPLGKYELGSILGTHSCSELNIPQFARYTQINENMYCIDDPNSKYYNRIVDINSCKKDWNTSEHLIDFPIEYEYLIEIRANPHNLPRKRQCNFPSLF